MKLLGMLWLLMIGSLSLGILNSSLIMANEPVNPEVSAAAPPPTAPPQRFRRAESSVSFSGLKLTGRLKKPDLSYIYRRRGLRAEQIVNIPEDFNDEIVQGSGKF
jgi:hypothetical protein